MPIIPLECPFCGGDLQIDSNLEAAVCKYCKKPFVVKDAIVHNYINNVTNINAENVNIFTQKDFVIEAGELKEYKGESVNVVIPDNVKVIGYRAFMGKGIESVILPESVVTIGNSAFANCTYLTSVTIPDSVKNIYDYAFYGCSSLTNIAMPNSVEIMGIKVFTGCSALKSITIPYGVKTIGCIQPLNKYKYEQPHEGMFSGCSSLASVEIPDSVEIIGDHTFDGCSSLATVTIPKSVKTISKGAFKGCSALKSVTIPNGMAWIGAVQTETTVDWSGERRKVSKHCEGAFSGCSTLTEIVLPDSVEIIGDSAFRDCSSLKSINIPDSVRGIGDGAFGGCKSLASVKCSVSQRQHFIGTPFWEQWRQHCKTNNQCVYCGTRLPLIGKKCPGCGRSISTIKRVTTTQYLS